MNKFFINKWEKNKKDFENYLRNTPQEEYPNYKDFYNKVVEIVINKDLEDKYITSETVVLGGDDIGGEMVFITKLKNHFYKDNGFIYSKIDYGTCSACDTYKYIRGFKEDGIPTAEQVQMYINLALYIIQNTEFLSPIFLINTVREIIKDYLNEDISLKELLNFFKIEEVVYGEDDPIPLKVYELKDYEFKPKDSFKFITKEKNEQ